MAIATHTCDDADVEVSCREIHCILPLHTLDESNAEVSIAKVRHIT